jgi:hypothetical protein
MKVYTLTRTTNVYSDDVMVVNFLEIGDGKGTKEAEDQFDTMVGWGCSDENEVTVDLWVFDPTSTEKDKTTHVKSTTIPSSMFDEEEDES